MDRETFEERKLKRQKRKYVAQLAVYAVCFCLSIFIANHLFSDSPDEPLPMIQKFGITPPAEAGTKTIDNKIKGDELSRIYHLQECPSYNDIAERNIRWFKTVEEAETAGYGIAKNC